MALSLSIQEPGKHVQHVEPLLRALLPLTEVMV